MTQGGALAMVAYCIGILPLTKQLKAEFPDITQLWYTEYASAIGTSASVELYFNFIKQFGPGRGY